MQMTISDDPDPPRGIGLVYVLTPPLRDEPVPPKVSGLVASNILLCYYVLPNVTRQTRLANSHEQKSREIVASRGARPNKVASMLAGKIREKTIIVMSGSR